MSFIKNSTISSGILYSAAVVSGGAIPLSTAAQNIGAALFLIAILLKLENSTTILEIIKNPFIATGLTLGTALILGIFWTDAPPKDAFSFILKMRAYYLIPFFYIAMSDFKVRNLFIISFSIATLLSVFLSLLSAWLNLSILHAMPGDWSIFRTHTYHNFFAGILASGIFAVLLNRSLPPAQRGFLWLLFGLISFDIFFLVAGRTGQIVYLLMLIVTLLHWRLRTGLVIGSLLLLVSVFLLPQLSPVVTQGISKASTDLAAFQEGHADTSLGLRLTWHLHSLSLIKERPLLGHGTGSFKTEYARISGASNTPLMSENPHNDYLWLAVELGVLGGLLLVLLMCSAAWQGRVLQPAWRSTLFALLLGMGVATLANSFFTDNISGLAFVLLTCALLSGPRVKPVPNP